MSKRLTRAAGHEPGAPRLRRAYHDCRYGQLHLHNAIPAGGGFDELTSVVCVHGEGYTGRVFVPVLASLGTQRSVYALDLPGVGESDPATGTDFVQAGVHAVIDFVESMRIRRFDLLALAEGCTIAKQLAALRPEAVRRVVTLDGPELPGPAQHAELVARFA